jgi:hypothetical protein
MPQTDMKSINYLDVYAELLRIARRERITELTPAFFVCQQDAVGRMAAEEDHNEMFASALYYSETHDEALSFVLKLYRKGFIFEVMRTYIAVEYNQFGSAKEAAQAIFSVCCLLLNGQIRLLVSYKSRVIAQELFYVHGRTTEPLAYTVTNPGRFPREIKTGVQTYVHKNRATIDQMELDTKLLQNDEVLSKAYASAGRTIDWSEPQPLDYGMWRALEVRPGNRMQHYRSIFKLGVRRLLFGMLYWYSWAVSVCISAIGSGFFPERWQDLAFVVLMIISLVAFTWYILPRLLERREAEITGD